ncbi:MAG: hypothetical protein J1E41_05475 [Ruminococcus sp.]|nr:hypothetical protein [Ruminococcus sp.]
MKRILSIVVALTILLSIAVPMSVGAVEQVSGVKQIDSTNSSFKIGWNEYYGATRYKVEWSNSPNGTYIVDTEWATTYSETVYNRYAGTTYYVKVTPYVDGQFVTSAASSPVAVATGPNSVTNIKQTKATTNSLTISWTGSLGATAYKIYKYKNGVETYVGSSKTTSFTINKLSNKKSFDFSSIYVKPARTVNGYDALGSYSYISDYNLALTPQKGKTPSISSWYHNIGVVYFTRPDLKFQDGYNINVYKANKNSTVAKSTNGTRVDGLKQGQFYKVKTRSYSEFGTTKSYGAWSGYKYFTLGVKNIKITSKTKNSLKVSWAKVKGGKVSYDIFVSKGYNGAKKKLKKGYKKNSIKVTKCGKKKLSRNTNYYVYVQPKIKVGKKTYTSPIYSYIGTYTSY